MFRYVLSLGWMAVLILCTIPLRSQTVPLVSVTGRVIDDQGQPIAGARISIFPMDVAVSGGLPVATTDQEGRYRLVTPAFPGRTRFTAVKESAGYPDTQGLLFVSGKERMPEVSLATGNQEVNIHLGPPDGILEGTVLDSQTRTPLSKARITLRRAQPASMYSTSLPPNGHFMFALPPFPIEITVVAPGYMPWRYKDVETGASKLVLPASDHRVITIELRSK